jgi:HEAT repeat protein
LKKHYGKKIVYNTHDNWLQRNLMNKCLILIILSLFVAIAAPRSGYPQPKLPAETMPTSTPDEVKAYIRELYSNDPAKRVRAAAAIGRMGEKAKDAVSFLISMLDDSDFVLQQADSSVAFSTSPAKASMSALISIGSPAVEPLIAAGRNESAEVRKYAVEALGHIKDSRSIAPIISALEDRKTMVRESAHKALFQLIQDLKEQGDEKQLVDMLQYEEPSFQLAVIEALGNIPTSHVEKLVPFLGNKDPFIRKNAADALKKIGKIAVVPLINALYNSDDMQIRINAVMILGDMNDPLSVEPLIDSLKDKPITSSIETDILRVEVAKALGKIKDTRAIQPLIDALSYENYNVKERSAEALTEIGEPSVEPLIKLLRAQNTGPQIFAAKILGNIRDPRAVEPLIQNLLLSAADNKAWNFRLEATRALGKIKDPRAVDPLEMMLDDKVSSVREMAEWSLHEISGGTSKIQPKKKGFWNNLL